MLTIDILKEYGANVEEGLARCLNNEDFYLRLVGIALGDGNFARLENAVAAEDVKEAFEAAHALKGALGNLSLTPLFDPASRLTEVLRGAASFDEGLHGTKEEAVAYAAEIRDQKARLDALAAE